MKTWSRVGLAGILAIISQGCLGGAQLVQETERGGIVVYPFQADRGHLLSAFRDDALRLIRQRCPDGYSILREGEAQSRQRIARQGGMPGTEELVHERRWGIKFECK